jgi:hypothetical protein
VLFRPLEIWRGPQVASSRCWHWSGNLTTPMEILTPEHRTTDKTVSGASCEAHASDREPQSTDDAELHQLYSTVG